MRVACSMSLCIAVQYERVARVAYRRQIAKQTDLHSTRANQAAHPLGERITGAYVRFCRYRPSTCRTEATQRPHLLRDQEPTQSHLRDDELTQAVFVVFGRPAHLVCRHI